VAAGPVATPGQLELIGAAARDLGEGGQEVDFALLSVALSSPSVLAGTGIVAGRAGIVDDISAAVAFLCGPDAGYIHGTIFHIDGGMAGVGSLWEGHD
jgi:NAD(P)-dependent dehydrogenase (short-subunit alcohol dehydrogenase family)